MQTFEPYLTLDANIRFGKPIIKGTRIAVSDVLSWLSQGMTMDDIIDDFPELTQSQILACLAYAANKERHTLLMG